MRIFMNFTETLEEIRRDLKEMGHEVRPKTYQNKVIEGNPDFFTQELRNYVYTVVNPNTAELSPTQPWADKELGERLGVVRLNPGEAYRERPEVWNEFLDANGKFDYSYPERFNPFYHYDAPRESLSPLQIVASELARNNDSRQCYLSIWEPQDIQYIGGVKRVPCTLGYLYQIREGELHVTYMQRSADFATHFHNDLYLAVEVAKHLAREIDKINGYPEGSLKVGSFTHFVGSLHIYKKDVETVF